VPLSCEWQFRLHAAELEVLDGLVDAAAKSGSGSGGGSGSGSGSGSGGNGGVWRKLLSQDRASDQPRTHDAFVAASASQHGGELRALLQLQPTRLILSHASIEFLRTFLDEAFAPPDADDAPDSAPPPTPAESADLNRDRAERERDDGGGSGGGGGGSGGGCPFFQKVEVRPLHLRVDFLPRPPSYSDLLSPSAAGVAALVPMHNVLISLGRLRLGGQSSWSQLGRDALAEWGPQLLQQWHRVVTAIMPVASVAKITAAASQLVLAPLRHAPLRGLSHGSDALARAVGAEALSVAARLVDLLHLLLEQVDGVAAGSSPHYPEAAVRASLSHLAVASDAAIGLRNTIDRQRAIDEASAAVRR